MAKQEAMPEIPVEVECIKTPDVEQALNAIKDPHAAKKRYTVLRLAFAKATRVPFDEVFTSDENVCNQRVWWQKWLHDKDIAAAFDLCYQRALAMADEETLRQELVYARDRKRSIARYSSGAPAALASVMGDNGQRGSDRINAAMKLIGLADPNTQPGVFAPVGSNSETNQQVNVGDDAINAAIERELAQLAGGGSAGAAAPTEDAQQPG